MATLAVILWILVTCFAGAGLLLLGRSVWLDRKAIQEEPGVRAARAGLLAALRGASDLSAVRALPLRSRVPIVVEVARAVTGAERDRIRLLAAELGLVTLAERDCGTRWWWRRLAGARLLTILEADSPAGEALFDDPVPLVRAQAAEWAAGTGDDEMIRRITTLLADITPACRFTAKDALLRLGRPAVEPLRDYLAIAPHTGLVEALEVAGGLADPALLEPVLGLCGHPAPKVRLRAVIALGRLGGPRAGEAARALMTDADPRVRAAAAGAVGRLQFLPAAPELLRLLEDRTFEVRQRSAYALRALGAPGELLLRRALGSSDRFAADIAQQALATPDQLSLHPVIVG